MLSALLACVVAVAPADTTPPSVVLAGAPVATPAAAPLAAPAAAPLPTPAATRSRRAFRSDSMVLDKSERRLTLFYQGKVVQTYDVALGKNPVGAKQNRGDGRTPEGLYYIEGRNPQSKYHLSLRISYPSASDRARASQRGVSTGGDIMIHGLPRAFATVGALHRQQDWTEGCVAVTNEEIEEIWRAVPNGARILIRP